MPKRRGRGGGRIEFGADTGLENKANGKGAEVGDGIVDALLRQAQRTGERHDVSARRGVRPKEALPFTRM